MFPASLAFLFWAEASVLNLYQNNPALAKHASEVVQLKRMPRGGLHDSSSCLVALRSRQNRRSALACTPILIRHQHRRRHGN
jgi:hypothetical protein